MGKFTKSASEFVDTTIVQKHLQLAGDYLARHERLLFIEMTDRMLRSKTLMSFDSPLELIFWMWFSAAGRYQTYYPLSQIVLEQQPELVIGGQIFHSDFAVRINEPLWNKAIDAGLMTLPKLLVELDGHTFHERTVEQVQRRDRRDRAFQQDGWRVFHFSYTEFTTKPDVCVDEVFDVAASAAVDLYRQFALDVPPEYRAESLAHL